MKEKIKDIIFISTVVIVFVFIITNLPLIVMNKELKEQYREITEIQQKDNETEKERRMIESYNKGAKFYNKCVKYNILFDNVKYIEEEKVTEHYYPDFYKS